MKSNKEVLKRLAEVEKKLAVNAKDLERKNRCGDVNVLLQRYEYYRKEQEMTITPEEIREADEEDAKYTLEHYKEWLKLSPEEQQDLGKRDHDDLVELCRTWLNSEERKQFDLKYAEFEAARFEPAK